MKKETYYFSHDYNARNDIKLQNLLAEQGVAGIGVYWCIIEMLYEQGGTYPLAYKSIAFTLHTDEELIRAVIEDFDLFERSDKKFWSKSVKNRLKEKQKISEKRKQASLSRWKNNVSKKNEQLEISENQEQIPDANAFQIQCKYNTIKEKESKEKEIEKENEENTIKEKSRTRFSPPSVEEVNDYIMSKGYNFSAENFCDFYESKGWSRFCIRSYDWTVNFCRICYFFFRSCNTVSGNFKHDYQHL